MFPSFQLRWLMEGTFDPSCFGCIDVPPPNTDWLKWKWSDCCVRASDL